MVTRATPSMSEVIIYGLSLSLYRSICASITIVCLVIVVAVAVLGVSCLVSGPFVLPGRDSCRMRRQNYGIVLISMSAE